MLATLIELEIPMTNATFPFLNMDMTKIMADFNPVKIADQFTRTASNLQTSKINTDSIIAAQHKNIEALAIANKAAVEGLQALVTRQNEILQETVKETSKAMGELSKVNGPEEATIKHAELIKVSFEKALGNMKELAELVARSNAETAEAINARICESLEDFKKQAVKIKKKAK